MKERQTMGKRERKETDKKKKNKERKRVREKESKVERERVFLFSFPIMSLPSYRNKMRTRSGIFHKQLSQPHYITSLNVSTSSRKCDGRWEVGKIKKRWRCGKNLKRRHKRRRDG